MNIKSKKGLTLVEVIVAVAIMGIIIVPISLVFTSAYTNFIVEADKVAAQQSARAVLYGTGIGIRSYGVMGDLERSNATSGFIEIDDWINSADHEKGARSISIKNDSGVVLKKYSFDSGVLNYIKTNLDGTTSDVNYFANEKSSNDSPVVVTDFVVKKINKVPDPVTGIDKDTDTEVIQVTVTVVCGRSGNITLKSTYRIPNIEK